MKRSQWDYLEIQRTLKAWTDVSKREIPKSRWVRSKQKSDLHNPLERNENQINWNLDLVSYLQVALKFNDSLYKIAELHWFQFHLKALILKCTILRLLLILVFASFISLGAAVILTLFTVWLIALKSAPHTEKKQHSLTNVKNNEYLFIMLD